jgi:hypothetical protein
MALVFCTCHRCGDVRIPSQKVQLMVRSDDGSAQLSFRCPLCRAVGATPVNALQRHALDMLEVPVVHWDPPAELADPDRDGEPLGDLSEAVRLLEGFVGVEDFLAAADRPRS